MNYLLLAKVIQTLSKNKGRVRTQFLSILLVINIIVFGQNSPTISKVIEYRPAPGQHINRFFPPPEESDTYDHALAYANRILVGNNNQSIIGLGAFGGYIVVGFDHSIVNVKGEYDFKGYGNAFVNGSEPGVVMVCQDLNKNGKPDSNETWYELAGSEYHNNQTIKDYEIIYYRPNQIKQDVKWTDNQGNKGTIKHIEYATQNHIYPNWITEDKITFKGTKLPNNLIKKGKINLIAFKYGYIDNQPNNVSIDKNGFKIDWAVDKNGKTVQLDYIDFIRVHTGLLQEAGSLGETSTELRGIEDLHPQAQLSANIDEHFTQKLQLSINHKKLTISNIKNVVEIVLLDLTGKKYRSIKNQNSISLDNMENGIYIVHLKLSNNQIITKKIIL